MGGETWETAIGQGFKEHGFGDRELAGWANTRSDFGRTKREQWYGDGMRQLGNRTECNARRVCCFPGTP